MPLSSSRTSNAAKISGPSAVATQTGPIEGRAGTVGQNVINRPDEDQQANQGAIDYAKFRSRSQNAVIRVYDDAGNVIETHEYTGDFKEP
jgi:hypothetical protein